MLLIGDIHINARYQDRILTELRDRISQYPEEKNIIFLGDYVYHFAYDRHALLQLYNLFLELFGQGKNIYILSGNHDRLGSSFVFEEAKRAFDILGQQGDIAPWKQGSIRFITEPMMEEVEGEKVLFLPFFISGKDIESSYVPKNEKLKAISEIAKILEKSENKHEAFSGYINKYLAEQIDRHPDLTILHHYYINSTAFPGQRSKFSYKDVALNEKFLDIPNIKFISGHLHQAFTHTNYLCLGSVRSTSSLETNQNKYIFRYDTPNKHMKALPMLVNPQVMIRSNEPVTAERLLTEIQDITKMNESYFTSESRDIDFEDGVQPEIESISLILNVEHIDYDNMDEIIDPELRKTCKDVRLKKDIENMDNILENFKVSSEQLSGFADRKNILQEYMQKKFGNDYPKYEQMLKELKLL